MADTTANSTITAKKLKKGVPACDTIAQIGTKSFTWTVANGTSEVADTKVLGKIPAGCSLLGAYTKAANAMTVTTGIEYGISANANGAGASVAIANLANNGNVNWTYQPAAAVTQAAASNATTDGYLVATFRGANNVVATTVTTTFLFAAVDPEVATYSTFTI
jgi:hypothetical protein